ncbi:fasciclin domain-containing protein [Winogradskyella sp.]|uniref:fasciclin domain-containing protein n=1 Tax=Winogradskyella sp. TaxID=1883156 RepID=UPI0026395998|nr:fasciclin domain-containing protein [Winogradskyella sp.]
MKFISKTFKLLTVFLLVLGVTGCSDDDDGNPQPTVCAADAGTLTANATPVTLTDGAADISATPNGDIVVPTDYEVTYVLTSGTNLTIEAAGATPNFTVSTTGSYTIHTLVAETSDDNDSNFLDLSVINFGTTTGGDVLDIVTTNNICASLDVTGAPIEVIASILDIADDAGLTILSDALELSGLDAAIDGFLRNGDEFTVFAPTDDAFVALLNDVPEWSSLNDIPAATLEAVLLYHVLGVTQAAQDFVSAGEGYANTLSTNGPDDTALSVYFRFDSEVQLNGGSMAEKGANVSSPDTNVGNGIIHVIDKVLLLPTIADFAAANPALSSLVAALGAADNSNLPGGTTWLGTVSGDDNTTLAPYTVFAPTNDAFADLLDELDPSGNTGLGDLDPALVDDVLTFHVVSGNNVQSSGLGALNGVIPTLGGNLDLDGTVITDANGRESNILASLGLVDIQATNGVVHAIDTVILPPQ